MIKSVVLELEWVLRHLQALPNVEIKDRQGVELAINALADGFDFTDALHHASYRPCSSVATFDDRKFARPASARGWNL